MANRRIKTARRRPTHQRNILAAVPTTRDDFVRFSVGELHWRLGLQ